MLFLQVSQNSHITTWPEVIFGLGFMLILGGTLTAITYFVSRS